MGKDRTTLAQALATLREDLDAQVPPPAVLAAARRAAQRLPQPSDLAIGALAARSAEAARRRRTASGWFARRWPAPAERRLWAGAAACACVLGASLLLALRPLPSRLSREAAAEATRDMADAGSSHRAAAADAAESGDERLAPAMHFLPLVDPERLRALAARSGSGDASEGRPAATAAWVMTAELPQQRLAAMGLPYDPGRAAEPLRAELLVAGSGEVLAVRLVP